VYWPTHCPPIAHSLLIIYLLLTHYTLLNLFKTRDFCFLTNLTIAVFWHKNRIYMGAHLKEHLYIHRNTL
jgi:hypothetical protein